MWKAMQSGKRRAAAVRYLAAVSCFAAALLLTLLLRPTIDSPPTPLFVAVVALSAWRGGRGPSLLATALSALAIGYFFTSSAGAFDVSWDTVIGTGVFVLVALLVSGMDAARKRSLAELNQLLADEREARREAEAASRAKDEFLAMVTHELRTPLNVISGWAEALQGEDLDGATRRLAAEKIARNAAAQQRLIGDLLDASRIVAGTFRVEMREVEIASVVREAIEAVELKARAKNIRLQTNFQEAALPVNGDAGRLRQLAANLLSNAVKFTPEGGAVEVTLARVGDCAHLRVCDTGCGIAPEFLPYIFDRFRQENRARARAQRGLGLGLAIVRHIAKLHGGSVRAVSDGAGRGAAFTVEIPLVPEAKREPEAGRKGALSGEWTEEALARPCAETTGAAI